MLGIRRFSISSKKLIRTPMIIILNIKIKYLYLTHNELHLIFNLCF